MYEVAKNSSGLLEGRKPVETEAEARTMAIELAAATGEAYQVWGPSGLIDVIASDPIPSQGTQPTTPTERKS